MPNFISSYKVRAPVDVHRGAGDIAVTPGRQVGGDGGDLLREPGATEIARLVKVAVDPGHDVIRVGGIEAFGGEDIVELFGEAGCHDGSGAHAVHQNAILSKAFRQVLGDAA